MHVKLRKALKILAHCMAVCVLYLAFSGALFLGLQVRPAYGSAAFVGFLVLLFLYIRFGFRRRS